MSVDSIRKKSDASGDYIQLLSGSETDGSGNATKITPVAIAGARKMSVNLESPLRTVTETDTTDQRSVPSAITSAKITVGDASMLWAFCHITFSTTDSDDEVVVLPMVLDDSNNFLSFFDAAEMKGFQPIAGDYSMYCGTSEVTSRIFRWDVGIAENIGMFVRIGSNVSSVKLYAGVSNGVVPDGHIAASKQLASSVSAWANNLDPGAGGE